MKAFKEIYIAPCTGARLELKNGEILTVMDEEGGQVADLFAECLENSNEFLSPAVTLDCHESLRLNVGDELMTNLYRPMFRILWDDVGEHDLLFPSCRPEMYDFFYGNGKGHPNCYDNINQSLGGCRPIIQPVNLFMHTRVDENGKILILPPLSKAGDKIVLQALMDVKVGLAACSVSEGECNARKCGPIRAFVNSEYSINERKE